MNIKHPISILTLTLTPFFIATGCSSTGGQHPTSVAKISTPQHINAITELDVVETPMMHQTPEQAQDILKNNNLAITDIVTKTATDINGQPESAEVLEMLGVLDNDTPTETTASNNPRPAKHVFQFGFNKAELSDEEKNIIQDHGQFLASHPSQSIVVHGHADSQGDQNYNQFLSEKRAQHVAALLKKAGASKDQIETFSWSSTSPADVATNYKVNRRVELRYGQDYFAQKTQ